MDTYWNITRLEWGAVILKNKESNWSGGDVIVCGNDTPISWNWKSENIYVDTSLKSPLRHSPGIVGNTIAFVANILLKYNVERHLIISKGAQDQLPVREMPYLSDITVHQVTTGKELQKLFNKLNNGETSVCALLLHTTC